MTPTYTESDRCPICGAINLPFYALEPFGFPRFSCRGETIDIDGERFAVGTACWDAPFGDTCGCCLNNILNTETAMVGPNGYCHD